MSYYEEVEAVKELDDMNAVNDHIHNGWIILKIGEKSKVTYDPATELTVQEVGVLYVMGLKKTSPLPSKPTTQPAGTPSQAALPSRVAEQPSTPSEFVVTPEHLGQLPWREGPYGEWVFSDAGKHPDMTANQKKIHAWLLQKLQAGWSETESYKYKLSDDFIGKKKR